MNILHTFAQYAPYSPDPYSMSTSTDVSPATIAIVAFLYLIIFFSGIIFYVITALCMMRIFKKAGSKQWPAWVPFYNHWKLLEIGGQQGFWAIVMIIPVVNIVSLVFLYIAMYHIGKKLGKSDTFVLWAIFFPIVWFIWLAVDKSTWNDNASSAPSIDPDAHATAK